MAVCLLLLLLLLLYRPAHHLLLQAQTSTEHQCQLALLLLPVRSLAARLPSAASSFAAAAAAEPQAAPAHLTDSSLEPAATAMRETSHLHCCCARSSSP
jgi:hypothetical protein